MIRSVKGVGYCTDPTLKATESKGVQYESYQKWVSMLTRVHDDKYLSKHPSYRNVTICKEWYDYANFKRWFDSVTFKEKGWELDKDLKVIGSEIYSPDTCSFVPKNINYLLLDSGKTIYTDLPKGVTYHKRVGKYYMQCQIADGKYKKQYFETIELALNAYMKLKASVIRERVNSYNLDPAVFKSLMIYSDNLENCNGSLAQR